MNLVNASVPLVFTTFQPEIDLTALNVISQVSPDSCLNWQPVQLELSFTSTSLVVEKIGLSLSGMANADLGANELDVQPGTSKLSVDLKPMGGKLSSGGYQGQILIISGRDQAESLSLIPTSPTNFAFSIDPLWVSCRKPIVGGGIGLATLLICGLVLARRIRSTRLLQKATITGTIKSNPASKPRFSCEEKDLLPDQLEGGKGAHWSRERLPDLYR